MNKYVTIGIVGLAAGFVVYQQQQGGADRGINIPALVQNGALVIDVRTEKEFSSEHIEGAINIPYDIIDREIEQHAADRTRQILVYCRSGNRSSQAKQTLKGMDYTHVFNGGGFTHMRRTLQN